MTCLSCNSITPHSPQIMHSIAVLCLSLHFLGTATLPSAAGTLSWKGLWPCGRQHTCWLGPRAQVPGMAGIPCCLTPLQQLGFCTSAQLRHDLQQGNSLSALSATHQKTGTAAALPVLEHSQERLMSSSVPACLSSEGNNSTGGCQGKESRFCATVLRREAIIATEHTRACAVPDGELRAAAKPGADGRNHELLP